MKASPLSTVPSKSRATASLEAAHAEPWQAASRISHADELQLACRLAECRREMLSLALLTLDCIVELRRLRAELAGGKLAIGEILELDGQTEEAGLAAFRRRIELAEHAQHTALRAFRKAAKERAAHDRAAREEKVAESPAARELHAAPGARFTEQVAASQQLVHRIELRPDIVTRLLGSAALAPEDGVVGSSLSASLPAPLDHRYRTLEREVGRIRNRFMTANQGLVSYVVQRYLGMGLSHEDLMQEGNIGLLRAIEKFDHRRGGRFGTYAVWWVRQGVRRALANQSRTIRIPVHALGARYSLDQAARKLALQLGREPNEEELSGATGVGAGNVAQLLSLSKEPLSLDAPRGNDLDTRLGDSIADATSKSSMEQVVERQRSEQLGRLLCALSPRERDMVRMRFGLDGSDECTLEQIGSTFSVTRERVRQIVGSALEKLNRQTRMLHLELQGGAE